MTSETLNPPPFPGVAPFRRKRLITPDLVDWLGHVGHQVWLGFVQDLVEAHSFSVGLNHEAYHRIGGFFVVRRHEINYHLPVFEGDEIEEVTWASSFDRIKGWRHAWFFRDDKLVVSVNSKWVYVDKESGRPRKIDAEVIARFKNEEWAS